MDIFRDARDARTFMAILADVVERKHWRCLAYCLMRNHFHLLLETPEANLAAGMQRLNGDYARYFNDRRGRWGHVFGARYGSTRVTSDEQFWWVVRYIANNPVKAGLCREAKDWDWSSSGAVASGKPPPWLQPDRLIELGVRANFAPDGVRPLV